MGDQGHQGITKQKKGCVQEWQLGGNEIVTDRAERKKNKEARG